MKFIGVISDDKYIKSKLIEHLNTKNNIYNIININPKNINTLKNIDFETIVINQVNFEENDEKFADILNNSKYVIVNSDNKLTNKDKNNKVITYGLNFDADVTVSSIKEDKIMVCMQKEIKNIYDKTEEPHEFNLKFKNKIESNKLEESLAIATIMEIYDKKIDKF